MIARKVIKKKKKKMVREKKKNIIEKHWFALIIFTLIALLIVSPIFKSINNWSSNDWDQHFFYYEAARKSIAEYKQFPFWNPWHCGGNALLAHPESAFLYPLFILNLIFGTVIGLKIQIFLHLIIGMFGMWLLAKYFKLAKYSSYFPPIIFMLSSWFVSRMFVGHTLYLSFTLLPYVLFFYLKSLKNFKFIIICALFLTLMIFGGGTTYPLFLTLLFLGIYSVLKSAKIKSYVPVRNLIIIVVIILLFGAIKVFPSFKFVKTFSKPMVDEQPTSFKDLYNSLLSREQDYKSRIYYADTIFTESYYRGSELVELEIQGRAVWAWHEYSAYIGIIPLLLFITAIVIYFKKYWDLIITSFIFLICFLGYKFYLWKFLTYLPFIKSLHGPSRAIMVFVFVLAILAGLGSSFIEKWKKVKKIKKYVMIALILIVLIDLFSISMPIYSRIFNVKPLQMENKERFLQVMVEDRYISQYPNLLQNVGSVNCYERVHPSYAAAPIIYSNRTLYPYYYGEAYLFSNNKTQLLDFSPNKFTIAVDTDKEDKLILNQNYFNGWKVKGKEVEQFLGKVTTTVNPDDKKVVFYYLPNVFIVGLIISIISLGLGLWWFWWDRETFK